MEPPYVLYSCPATPRPSFERPERPVRLYLLGLLGKLHAD